MIPYVIICKSCSAKLKVSVPNLIGKTIDCPKCSTELTLTPPAGFENPLASSADTSESTTNRFDDLDDLLGQVQNSSPQQQRSKKRNATAKPVDQVQKPAASVVDDTALEKVSRKIPQAIPRPKQMRHNSEPATIDSPLLPDGSWDSDELKKRKRLIKFGSLGVLATLLAAVGIFFLAGGNDAESEPAIFQESPPALSGNENTNREQQETGDVEPNSKAGQSPIDDASRKTASVTDLDGGEASAVRGAEDFAAPIISDSGFDTPAPKQPDSPLPLPSEEPEKTKVAANAQQPNPPSSVSEPRSVTDAQASGGGFFVKESPKESPLVTDRKSLSEFARALEEAGTVLSEIKDQALLKRDSALIGLPKYFVEPLNEDPVDVPKQLAVSVSGLQVVDSPMLDVLLELESLSGIPVSFDWKSTAVRATDFSQKMSLKTRDENFESLFVAVADQVGLKAIASDQGVMLTGGQNSEVSEHTWKLSPPLSDASVAELKGFIVRTWPLEIAEIETDEAAVREELEETVTVTSDQVTLSCDADLYARLNGLIVGMTSAATPESTSLNMADPSVTPTAFSVDPILDRPLELTNDNPFRKPYRIGSLLRQIRQQTGLNIFVDWPDLQSLNWSPNASIPGSFNEANCRDALEQLARSLKASWIVIDEKTVLLTSFETANSKSETEVYPVKFLLQKNLTAGELKRVLEDTLRQQLQMPGVSVVYFGEYDCLIAHAPQSVHRQLYSILNRLWQDLK